MKRIPRSVPRRLLLLLLTMTLATAFRLATAAAAAATVDEVQDVGDDDYNPYVTSPTLFTASGYDVPYGTDPICWITPCLLVDASDGGGGGDGTNNPPPVCPTDNSSTSLEWTSLLPGCPDGTILRLTAPPTAIGVVDDAFYEVGETYDYGVEAEFRWESGVPLVNGVDEDYWQGDITLVPSTADVTVIMCNVEMIAFCNPFVQSATIRTSSFDGTPSSGTGDCAAHVTSETKRVALEPATLHQRINLSANLSIKAECRGSYYAIVALKFITMESNMAMEYTIANPIMDTNNRLATFREAPKILKVERTTSVVVGCVVAVALLVQCALLFPTIKHRKDGIMKLAQVRSLIVMQIAGIVATFSSLFFSPTNDLYCNLEGGAVLIPLQIMFGIVFARLWRIHALISPLLLVGTKEMSKERRYRSGSNLFSTPRWIPNALAVFRRSRIRREITDKQLAKLVLYLSLPQIIVQALSLGFEWQSLTVLFDARHSVGRLYCENERGDLLLKRMGLATFISMVLAVVWVAYKARFLPSHFNESLSMFDGAIFTLFVTVLGASVIAITDNPTTSPEVEYIIMVVMTVCLTLNVSVRIVLPKLISVWSGEKIVLSKMMSEHQNTARESSRHRSISIRVETGSGVGARSPKNQVSPISRYSLSPVSSQVLGGVPSHADSLSYSLSPVSSQVLRCAPSNADSLSYSRSTVNSQNLGGDPSYSKAPGTASKDVDAKLFNRNLQEVFQDGPGELQNRSVRMQYLFSITSEINRKLVLGLHVPENEWESLSKTIGGMEEVFYRDRPVEI